MQDGSTDEPIKVLLADDHTMFREGLASILTRYADMEVVAEVPNDEEAIRLARELKPNAVIMQVQMPFEKAKEALRQMRSVSPPPKVIIVTMFEEPRYLRDLMELGATSYLVKTSSSEHLLAAVRAASHDPTSRNVVVGMPLAMLDSTPERVESVLSARELEVLLLVARGLSNRQIASRFNIAEATVKRHLANIYPKLQVGSRGEAARRALLEGWITIEQISEEGAQ